MSKTPSLLWIIVAYAVSIATGAAYLFLDIAAILHADSLLLTTFIADVLATTVIFTFSRVFKNSSFYDAYWSVIPPLIFHYWMYSSQTSWNINTILLAVVIWCWAIRLTWNWIKHWEGMSHEDWRYVNLKINNARFAFLIDFLGIHLFPTIQVFLGLIPVYYFIYSENAPHSMLLTLAFIIGVSASATQLIADRQLHRFINTRKPGQIMHQGLWKYSRHPNYFGELMFWFSLALFGLSVAPYAFVHVSIGFVAMLFMFVFVSIPMMEKRSLANRPGYQAIIDTTSMLLLLPPKK